MNDTAVSIIRVLGLTALALLMLAVAMYWLYAQASPLTATIFEDSPPTIDGFIATVSNPPVCYYEGYSERTERPHSTRDWIYTLVLGDCHPQQETLPKLLIDAVIPNNPRTAGSTTHDPQEIRVQYAQEVKAEAPSHSLQETEQ